MIKSEIRLFLSVVVVLHNKSDQLYEILDNIQNITSCLVSDYEIIIVDNGSSDKTSDYLREFTSEDGFPNIQVYRLANHVDDLTGRWVGIENSIGDIVISIDPSNGDIEHLPLLTREASNNNDIVFTQRKSPRSRKIILSKLIYMAFGMATKFFTGLDLDSYSTSLISINRRVVNYLLQFPDPQTKFRYLPSIAGFSRSFLNIPLLNTSDSKMNLLSSISRGIRLVTSSSANPLRVTTALSAVGAFMSLIYSLYVLSIWLFKEDVAPGWISISMQLSGMFFLLSLVLLVLSEYVIEISRKANSGPTYYIVDEFTSVNLKRTELLNVEVDSKVPSPNNRRLFGH